MGPEVRHTSPASGASENHVPRHQEPESKHRGQVRLILLDQKGLPEKVNPVEIWEKTGKPVLVRSEEQVLDPRYMFMYRDRVFLAAGIDMESAKRVLKVVFPDSGCEALRIAGIVLKSILGLHNV